MFSNGMVFFYNAVIFAFAALVLIPKQLYKRYFVYGLIYGGLFDVAVVLILEVFRLIKYEHMGAFSIFGWFPFWLPVAWIFVMMFDLYLLPEKKLYFYLYILSFSIFGFMVGQVLEGFNLLEINKGFEYVEPFFLFAWFAFTAWVYQKNEKIVLR